MEKDTRVELTEERVREIAREEISKWLEVEAQARSILTYQVEPPAMPFMGSSLQSHSSP